MDGQVSALRYRFPLQAFAVIQWHPVSNYLVKGIMPREGLVVVWGPPKCGKTFWIFDLMLHVALGWPYRGRRVTRGAVVYVCLEGERGISTRIEAFRRDRLAEGVSAEEVPFYIVVTRLDLASDHGQLIAEIRAQLGSDVPASAIVIDTLNRSLAGSESSDEDMGNYVRACDAVREAFRCAVVVVHHCGHETTRPRGHTSLLGAADAQIAVKRNAAGQIVATVEYMKDGPTGAEIICGLKIVELDDDADGDPITSCVVEAVDGVSPGAGSRLTKLNDQSKLALDMLRRAIDEAGDLPPGISHVPIGYRAVKAEAWRRYCDNGTICASEKADTRLKAFKRAADKLQAAGIIGTAADWVWIIAR